MIAHRFLQALLRDAVTSRLPGSSHSELLILPCPDSKFGDYQTSSLIAFAKNAKLNPRDLAAKVAVETCWPDWIEKVEVAGPGFLNFRLAAPRLGSLIREALSEGLFCEKLSAPKTVVLDFSSPNVAKPMHVGHIRSTILGDSLARIFRFLGHTVIADNHIGDWGTQFGKLLVGWKQRLNREALLADPIGEMERLYREVNRACETSPVVLEEARAELVKLQNGDTENLKIWKEMIDLSRVQFDTIYNRLGIRFDETLGEGFYNSELKSVVASLCAAGIAKESEGALVVFFESLPQLTAHPSIVQKSDGAANYMTTDLATLEYRAKRWSPTEVIYVTDSRQQLHFQQLFATYRRWRPGPTMQLRHVWFGTILGEDGKPFRTRSGDVIKLADLLDEAEARALITVTEKNPEFPEAERREIARIVGLGAIKYADLLPNRQSDYVFSWDKMLALNGNTAPYLQYACARISSLVRKSGEDGQRTFDPAALPEMNLTAQEEINLAKQLMNFGWVLETVAEEARPNFLCNYLYNLAGHFTQFYESCPVLKSEGAVRESRLALCRLTGRVLGQGLNLLGIETAERM